MSILADLLETKNDPRHDLPSPLALAQMVDPSMVATPALRLIDDALVKVETGDINRLIISVPPQEGKSSLVTRFGNLWSLRRNPDQRIGIVSYSDSIAETFSRLMRQDIEQNDGSEEMPDLGLRLQRDNKAVSRWSLDKSKGGIIAVGIGAGLTGRPLDRLCIDDPVKDWASADSAYQSEQAWIWWQSVARPRLAPNAPVILVLTRWHESDMAGRAISKEQEDREAGLTHFDEWTVINIPAQADHRPELGETDPLGREPGEFMESARSRTQAHWQATKAATSSRIWVALYQGKPSPDDGDILQREWFQTYREPMWARDPETGGYAVPGSFTLTASFDFAFKDRSTSDYVVGQVWAYKGATAYLVDQIRKRMSFTESLAAMRNVKSKWPQIGAILVEDKANGSAIIDTLRREIPGIIAINPKESKAARARAVAPYIEAGNIFLPHHDIALFRIDDLIEEAVAFPNGAHDDQIDAMSQALQRIMGKFLPNGARAWLESLSTQCENCGMPNDNVPGPRSCTKCGEPMPEWAPDADPEPEPGETAQVSDERFDLSSFMADRPMGRHEQDAMEAVRLYGPQVWQPFQQPWRR